MERTRAYDSVRNCGDYQRTLRQEMLAVCTETTRCGVKSSKSSHTHTQYHCTYAVSLYICSITLYCTLPQHGGLDEHDAVLFFDLGDYFQTSVTLDVPRTGRYVLIKLLRPRCGGDNVDVQYIGLCGWQGVRGFAAGEVC